MKKLLITFGIGAAIFFLVRKFGVIDKIKLELAKAKLKQNLDDDDNDSEQGNEVDYQNNGSYDYGNGGGGYDSGSGGGGGGGAPYPYYQAPITGAIPTMTPLKATSILNTLLANSPGGFSHLPLAQPPRSLTFGGLVPRPNIPVIRNNSGSNNQRRRR